MECPECKGEGIIEKGYIMGVVNQFYECLVCDGTGEVSSDYFDEEE